MRHTITRIITTALLASGSSWAQQALEVDPTDSLAPLEIIGGKEKIYELVGSAAYLDAEDWRSQGYTNINRILGRVPGVYVREEDGFGNFPNISMRGADGTRSDKVTIMEDGILTAPAPYSAPSAYYFPRASRMAGLEILKGSSQIKYGPQTTAGAINFLSTPIPGAMRTQQAFDSKGNVVASREDPGQNNFYWRSTFGSYNTWFNHAYYGDTVQTEAGTFGYLIEILQESSDGFRDLDGGGDTGFTLTEPMVKLFWEPNTMLKQRFEFKYGRTDFDADETYVGLNEADFSANPYRRYAGTQFDNMATEQNRSYLKWIARPSDSFQFELAAYYNDFARNWYKIRGVDVTDPADVALLDGSAPGSISLRANSREYEAYGLQFSGLYEFETGQVEHDLSFGVRWHYDEIDRFQRDDVITSTGTGANGFAITSFGAPGGGGDRVESAEAISLWASDEISFGKLVISPGFRYETIDLEFTNGTRVGTGTRGSGSESYFAPGVGFTYELGEADRLFGGVFKGFSLAGPRSTINGVEKEESIGYELGIRHRDEAFAAELVSFLTDFENLISAGAGFGTNNGNTAVGSAQVWGFESLISYDAGMANNLSFSVPMYLSATWTSAELTSDVAAGLGGDDIYKGGMDGSNIPYIPEWKLAGGIGLQFENWGANLDATYTSSTFGTAANLDMPPLGNQQAGEIDAAFLVDLSGYYQVSTNVKLVGGVQNLFDEEILVSRAPLGARAGAPRTFYGGFELTF